MVDSDPLAVYRSAVGFSIDYSITYLIQGFLTVVIVFWMTVHTTNRIRRSPIFAILVLSSVLVIVQVYINISQLRDQVVSTAIHAQRVRYTLSVTLLFWIPFLVDFALIVRIAAFFPAQSSHRHRWYCLAAIAFPALIKIPRGIIIGKYTRFVWDQTSGEYTIAETVVRIAQSNDAIYEWSMMLADELYCTFFLVLQLWRLGWGWGTTKKTFSDSLLSAIRVVLISSLTTFIVPTVFLITLIALQVQRNEPVKEGYVFVTTCHISVIGAAFACLWPSIRAERRENSSYSGSRQISSEPRSGPSGQTTPYTPRIRQAALERLDSFTSHSPVRHADRPFGRYMASSQAKSMDETMGNTDDKDPQDIELGTVALRGSDLRLSIAGDRIDPDETLHVIDYSSPSRYKSSRAAKVLCDEDAEAWDETVNVIRPRRLSLRNEANPLIGRPRENSTASKAISLEEEMRQQALVEEGGDQHALQQSPTSTLVNHSLPIDTVRPTVPADLHSPALASSPFSTSPFAPCEDGQHGGFEHGFGLNIEAVAARDERSLEHPLRSSSAIDLHMPSQPTPPAMPRVTRFSIPRRPAPASAEVSEAHNVDPAAPLSGTMTAARRRPRQTPSVSRIEELPSVANDGVKITTLRESTRD